MLELFTTGLMSAWLNMAGMQPSKQSSLQAMTWFGSPAFFLSGAPEPSTALTLEQYLGELSKKGWMADSQGIWIQSGPVLLSSNQGTVPLPAASLTKIATSLASLHTWEHTHRFDTVFSATGPIKNGVLQGDLVVTGSGDPLFVWEEAIAVGNALNRMGIKRVTGNLIVKGKFYMNYSRSIAQAGLTLKQGFNSSTWARGYSYRYYLMPKGTPKPQLAIAGGVKIDSSPSVSFDSQAGGNSKQTLLLRHRSVTLAQILKEMNVYSNNEIAEMLADLMGGAQVVRQLAAEAAGVPRSEILLINGSGLGVENRISPRAACAMLMAIQRKMQPLGLTIGDLFPVSGHDRVGTMIRRHMPEATVMKTGTLRNVSALAGVMPTRDRGLVWFAIVNRGNDIPALRVEQDKLLQNLIKSWNTKPEATKIVLPTPTSYSDDSRLGADVRNHVLYGG
ncbi:MAG TPA: D-alanyl-D-alanine carboxypeptidase [Leptolyngbyaceae cyanobacterium]